ncbi:Cys-tRNA(Pro) deacylase [Microlunatus panaciterrae]|uniref:Cys-tRNA(Pro)/Cys-tRNA(Cys) deacylase n=1 Tax=Microlunatus panaciterrae TaxID=400768 RepID=A0ABS2RFL1_9ACTN|nr:Cys-tRNA(Pro) deacylase [Microlunatus panaciterrae]MBM7797307.1 Cys-tRNA(Pro)/Cys-tRNA(Cys) deacylase [Microlunatus panaciterrae]
MTKKQAAGATPATVALTRAGVAFVLRTYEHRPGDHGYGEEAAEALGVDPRRIFKTLVAEVDSELVVAVVPVARQLDLKALAVAIGGKRAQLADPAVAARSSGYVIGGISPVGQRTRLRTVVDDSALTFDTVLVSAGRRGLQVELAPADLVRVTQALTCPIGH